MVRKLSAGAIVLALFTPLVAHATLYELSVTRKSSNIYQVDGKRIVIHTRFCYEYAYSEDAILKTSGYGDAELIFPDSKEKCEVKALYSPASQAAGKYRVQVTREEDDWYSVFGRSSIYIRTSGCLQLGLMQEAILTMQAATIGRIVFEDGQSCMVDGVYSRMKPS